MATKSSEAKTEKAAPESAVAASTAQVPTTEVLDSSFFGNDAGAGSENVAARDQALPFLVILQGLSPQCQEGRPEFNEDAKPGQIFNTLTQQRWKGLEGVVVVPCGFDARWIEWVPRDAGGGFVRIYAPNEKPIPADGAALQPNDIKVLLDSGNEAIYTQQHYVLLVDREAQSFMPVLISMSSTQLKHGAKWNSLCNLPIPINGVPTVPARFARIYRLCTKLESNKKGSWHGWSASILSVINPNDPFERGLYEAGKAFYKSVQSGAVVIDMEKAKGHDAGAGDAGGLPPAPDGEQPF
jgi:hypothetical protein